MSSRTDRLLCCAVAYSQAEIPDVPVPKINSSSSVEEVISSMMNVLWYEAKQTMIEGCSDIPSDPYLHAVDVDSNEPGIVSSKGKSDKLDIHRRKLPVPSIKYTQRTPLKLYNIFEDLQPEIKVSEAFARAEKDINKNIKKTQKAAIRELKNENLSLNKIERRREAKKKREDETEDERNVRLAEMREKRARKKEEKRIEEELKAKEVSINVNDVDGDNLQNDEDVEGKEDCIEVEKKLDDNLPSAENLNDISVNIHEMLELEASADPICDRLLPQRIKARNRKTKFYPSPVPFDRHLIALEACYPCQHVKEALIDLIPDERIKIIQGPPGTGKTTELLNHIKNYENDRIFVCASTNVAAANLYTRIIQSGTPCSLLMPQSRIPIGTPITSQDPSSRIICSTISGRNGPILDAQEFNVILLDESAQCLEALVWGLLRPEVTDIIMVGDIHQLPALVSEKGQKLGYDRSLMQRLIESKYPYSMLKTQRRMHPDIVDFPNRHFYNNELITEYTSKDNIDCNPYMLYNVKGICKELGTSFVNEIEVEFCIKKALMLKKYSNDIIILTPYQAQARQLLSLGSNIPIHTIDSFQGREADIVVLSMVRTESSGFWSDERRLCVALTRARHILCVVGNCESWSYPLNKLYEDAAERNLVNSL